MRSLLYTPGHRAPMVSRVLDGGLPVSPDVALLDLEDGVPQPEKENARRILADAIASSRGRSLRYVRITRGTKEAVRADLAAVVRAGLDGVVVPKIARPEELAAMDEVLLTHERAAGLPDRAVRVIAAIETAAGLLEAPGIARGPRVVGVMFGSEDFAADLGLPTQREGEAADLLYARSAIVVAAAAARVLAFDGIWANFKDSAGLRADGLRGRRLGFSGRQCIHPDQIAIVNEIYAPSADQIAHARRVLSAFEDGVKRGLGAVALDGEMLDAPIVERARRTLKTAGS